MTKDNENIGQAPADLGPHLSDQYNIYTGRHRENLERKQKQRKRC